MHKRGVQCIRDIGRTPLHPLQPCVKRPYSSISHDPLTKEEKADFKKVVSKLVKAASHGDRHGWKHAPSWTDQEEKRLIPTLTRRNPQTTSRFHVEDNTLWTTQPDDCLTEAESEAALDIYEPGSFVEVRRNNYFSYGIILGVEYIDRNWQIISLSMQGVVLVHYPTDVMFLLPSVAPKDLVSRAGVECAASTDKAVKARVELLKRLRNIEKRIGDAYSQLVKLANSYAGTGPSKNTYSFYERFSSPDPEQWSEVTVSEVARVLLPKVKLDPFTTCAMHRHLLSLPQYFLADPTAYLSSQLVHVRPRRHVQEIETVKAMLGENPASIDAFVSKARQIMAVNRRRATESTGQPPSKKINSHKVWTDDEVLILGFLLRALRTVRTTQTDPYRLDMIALLKKLEPEGSLFDHNLLHNVLIDLSVVPPWVDIETRKPELKLEQSPQTIAGPLGTEDFYPEDTMASLRHDFGDMPVYVIDDISAEELDDGVSIEHITSEPTSCWVHVHVADPTAIIPPTHQFALNARQVLQTHYYFHRTWRMLPQAFTGKGLGSGAERGLPERVMTFSFKVDQGGDIVDYSIRAGLVRNLRILNYDSVDLAMGIQPPRHLYPFGGAPPLPPAAQLSPTDLKNLHTLNAVHTRLIAKRLSLNSFVHHIRRCEVSFSPRGLDDSPALSRYPTTFSGFPELTFKVVPRELAIQGSRSLVAEFMKGACRIASLFCRDHGIPAVRRAGQSVVVPSEAAFADLLAIRDDAGFVDYLDMLRYGIIVPSGEFTHEPKMHWSLGIPEGEGYTWVTSPLRRFPDLAMHWQIKHALLKPTAKPLFPLEYIQDLCKDLQVNRRSHNRSQQHHSRFWSLMFIKRFMENPIPRDPDLPNPLENMVGLCTRVARWDVIKKQQICRLVVESLATDVVLTGVGLDENIELGERVKIKFDKLHLGTTPTMEMKLA